jgi:hypothetical protein
MLARQTGVALEHAPDQLKAYFDIRVAAVAKNAVEALDAH